MKRRFLLIMILKPAATMVRMLQLSLGANLLLLGAFYLVWLRDPPRPEVSLVPQTVQPAKAPPEPAPSLVNAPVFHWRDLDSPDFAVFVANLREIGCPEPTIRDIVDGELREIYAKQANEAKEASFAPLNPSGTGSAPLLGAPSRQPRTEEQRLRVLASLLEPETAANSGAASAPAAQTAPLVNSKAVVSVLTQAEQIPAAFQVGDDPATVPSMQELPTVVSDASLDSETASQLTRMRQDFAASLSQDSTSPDPGSTQYLRQWMKAKRESDDRFSSMYGGDALNAAYRQSVAKQGVAVGK
jgi:hypothetical protein